MDLEKSVRPTPHRNEPKVAGIVLAGGQSKRFGEEKCTYRFQGRALVLYSVDVLQEVVDTVLIVTSKAQEASMARFGTTCVDLTPDSGPVAGLLTAFSHVTTSHIVVLPCDMPFVSGQSLEQIVKLCLHNKSQACVATDSTGRMHPLVGCYDTSASQVFRESLTQGDASLHYVMKRLESVSTLLLSDRELTNINTLADLP